jgi:hypothetical protein
MGRSAARERAPAATVALLTMVAAAVAIASAGCAGRVVRPSPTAGVESMSQARAPSPPDQDYSEHVVVLPAGRGVWTSPQAWVRPVSLAVAASGRGEVRRRRCGATLTGRGFRIVIDTCRHGDVRRVRARYRSSRPLRLRYRAQPAGSSPLT